MSWQMLQSERSVSRCVKNAVSRRLVGRESLEAHLLDNQSIGFLEEVLNNAR